MANKFIAEKKQSEFEEKVLEINRISRTVKGGRRIRFRALVIVGNRNGRVGFGVAKATEVVTAIKKARDYATKHTVEFPIINGTIPHQVSSSYGSASVLLKPAQEGTSLIAGGSVRNLLEIAGIRNIVSKSLGSNNKINVVTATVKAISSLRAPLILKKAEIKEIKENQIVKPEPAKPESTKKKTAKVKVKEAAK